MSEKIKEQAELEKIEAERRKIDAEREALEAKQYPRAGFWIGALPGSITIITLVVGIIFQNRAYNRELDAQADRLEQAKQEASSAKQEASLAVEKARLETVRADLLLKETQAKQKSLDERVRLLRGIEKDSLRRQFVRYSKACGIGGKIAVAKKLDDAKQFYAKFSDAEINLVKSPEIIASIDKFGKLLRDWKDNTRPDADLTSEALSLSIACKNAWRRAFGELEQVEEIASDLRVEIYDRAFAAAEKIAKAKSKASVESEITEFYALYYGEMVFVESDVVARAMVSFGNAIEEWKENTSKELIQGLLTSRLENLKKLMDNEKPESKAPGK